MAKSMDSYKFLAPTLFVAIFSFLFFLPVKIMAFNGVDDLRGRWDLQVYPPEGLPTNLIVYIGDLYYMNGDLIANGCMESPSNLLAPLALKAKYFENGSYYINMTSTVVLNDYEPFVIQFEGPVQTYGRGVNDDFAGGEGSTVRTKFFDNGKWVATHHDRRRKECPPVEIPPLSFWGDVRALQNLRSGEIEQIKTIFEGQTDIISSGVLVEKPDGPSIILKPYTDIFSPDVDFASKFRYIIPFEEAEDTKPTVASPYYFTLLDFLGNPIPGSTKFDIWSGCYITAPKNFKIEVLDNNNLKIEWDEVSTVNGFDPTNGIGFYQIAIGSWTSPGPDIYGSNHIKSTEHIIPWDDFEPNSPGFPDGYDQGVGLNRFQDGTYSIRIDALSVPPSGSGGHLLECQVVDFNENILFSIEEEKITITP